MPNLRDRRLKVNGIGSPALGRLSSREGGVYSTNVYTGRLRPEVQPLTLLYIIFLRKRNLFFIPCLKLCIPLNFCKFRIFKIRINHKNRTFSQLFKTINLSVSLFGPIHRPKYQTFLPFYILQLVKSQPFHVPDARKRYPFGAEALRTGHSLFQAFR